MSYVQQDLPPDMPLIINERLARIGLLDVQGPMQDPPSYLQHTVFHLYGLVQSSNSPGSLRKQASKIITALSNVQLWLEQARALARQLLSMTNAQLLQPGTLSLLNDLIEYSTRAYTGQTDPLTGDMHEGVAWIHDFIQNLAMFEITPYTGHSFSIQMIQDTHHPMAVRSLYHEDTL